MIDNTASNSAKKPIGQKAYGHIPHLSEFAYGFGRPSLCTGADAYARAVRDNAHGALDPIEGIVYRVERLGKVDFLAKWVRPDKADGCYLPSESGQSEIWNWRP